MKILKEGRGKFTWGKNKYGQYYIANSQGDKRTISKGDNLNGFKDLLKNKSRLSDAMWQMMLGDQYDAEEDV